MEPHELALAALAQSVLSSQRGNPTDKLDSLHSQNATVPINTTTAGQISTKSISQIYRTMPRIPLVQEDLTGPAPAAKVSCEDTQSTIDALEVDSTPPTSSSEPFSSQSTSQEGPLSQLSQLSQVAAEQEPLRSPARPAISIPLTSGQKRTADGQVKSISPNSPQVRGHARNTSAVSNASSGTSRIGEVEDVPDNARSCTDGRQLSAELRTRLSYAMVKVNNGWQSHSIDEVESLASQAGSPTSSTSTLHHRRNQITSPRTVIANIQGHPSTISSQGPAGGDFDLYSRHDQPSRTYESFWRDHSTTNYPTQRPNSHHPANSPPLAKGLAPPADIRPTTASRRSDTPKFSRPPRMPSGGSNSPRNGPRTPHRADYSDSPALKPSAQKTLQEQDAIETLLFMSSPGNSGNMAHAFPPSRAQMSPQQSPLRAEFRTQAKLVPGRRVEFDHRTTGDSTESSEAGLEYTAAPSIRSGKESTHSRARGDAIDRMLDEMADSSSDDEEILLTYPSPRRVAAGRV